MSTQPHPTTTRPAMESNPNGVAIEMGRKKITVEFLINERGPFVRLVETNLDSPRRNSILIPIEYAHVFAAATLDLLEDYDGEQDTIDGTAKDKIKNSIYDRFTTPT